MSIQHPNGGNLANQMDAAGNTYDFEEGTTLVVALNENLGTSLSTNNESISKFKIYPNPIKSQEVLYLKGENINTLKIYSMLGEQLLDMKYNNKSNITLKLDNLSTGLYFLKINDQETHKLVIE